MDMEAWRKLTGPPTAADSRSPMSDPVGAAMAQEAAVMINMGVDPIKYWSWPRWRRKLVLLSLALKQGQEGGPSDALPEWRTPS